MTTKIMNIFLDYDLEIISMEYLEEYINYCIDNNQSEKIKFKTAEHHILPQAKNLPFTDYKKLQEHSWNGVTLTHSCHYYAHYLLTKAINHFSIYYAFAVMNNHDLTKGKLVEEDLISSEEYNLIMTKTLELQGDFLSIKFNEEFMDINGDLTTIAKERGKKYSKIAKETGCAIQGAYNAAETLKNKVVMVDGVEVSAIEMRNKKIAETTTKSIIINGEETTLAKEVGKKGSETKRKKSKNFRLMHITKGVIAEIIPSYELLKISAGLHAKTLDNYLGKSAAAQSRLKNSGKEDLIGLYSEEILITSLPSNPL